MMKLITAIICIACALYTNAQTITVKNFEPSAQNAFMIYRMAEKFHLQPKPLNDEFSIVLFNSFINKIDDKRLFFTAQDISSFSAYKNLLDDDIKTRKPAFLMFVTEAYTKRLQTADTMVDNICSRPFNFKLNEKYTVAEDTSYAKDAAALRIKLQKALKAQVLTAIINAYDNPTLKQIDSLEIIYRKKAAKYFKRSISRTLQNPEGVPQYLGNIFCESMAAIYDPHSAFFSLTEKENFESELGHKSMIFGFSLDEDEDENITINSLEPGSSAFQSGQLNKGDKIIKLQWEGKEAIDVSDASAREIGVMLDASNHHKLTLTVKKADGTLRDVVLNKTESTDADDDNKVKSFLLKGTKTVGYISLPSFYEDWENEAAFNGCANDVAKEIIKLKKENIDALIIDVRFNGGGSMQEATDLAGIFIDGGPVAQVKTREAKTYTLKDVNRGTVYDGPLFYMVNGYSASASEMVAGTLQDYNRAVIVGSPTYGKATGQTMLPLDTTINLEKYDGKSNAQNFVTLTRLKLYRVNGNTAQFTGVTPDVILPDVIEIEPEREANEPFAIAPDKIEANKYYKPAAPLSSLQQTANAEMDASPYFKALPQYITTAKKQAKEVDINLNISAAIKQNNAVTAFTKIPERQAAVGFTVFNNSYDDEKLKLNTDALETNDTWKKFLAKDPYLQLTYKLALQVIK